MAEITCSLLVFQHIGHRSGLLHLISVVLSTLLISESSPQSQKRISKSCMAHLIARDPLDAIQYVNTPRMTAHIWDIRIAPFSRVPEEIGYSASHFIILIPKTPTTTSLSTAPEGNP